MKACHFLFLILPTTVMMEAPRWLMLLIVTFLSLSVLVNCISPSTLASDVASNEMDQLVSLKKVCLLFYNLYIFVIIFRSMIWDS